MDYPGDLIKHAFGLCDRALALPELNQADLRRAVSGAYYALFHALTTDAALNWQNEHQRHRFARLYQHQKMKNCSSRFAAHKITTADPAQKYIEKNLIEVARSFVKLQQQRHTADYDNSKVWSPSQAYEIIGEADEAVTAWRIVRAERLAQEFLFELLEGAPRE